MDPLEQEERVFKDSVYDTEITELYKLSYARGTPVRLLIEEEIDEFVDMVPLVDVVSEKYEADDYSFSAIYDEISPKYPKITVDDIVLGYFSRFEAPDALKQKLLDRTNQAYRDVEKSAKNKFESFDDFQTAAKAWLKKIADEMEEDVEMYKSIMKAQAGLEKEGALGVEMSPVSVNASVFGFSPVFSEEKDPIQAEDGIDIFNDAIPSETVPYIRYVDDTGRVFSRVYTGNKDGDEPNYSVTINPAAEFQVKNTMYMSLWLGDPNSPKQLELKYATRDSISIVVYHLNTNYLTIESPIDPDPKKGLISSAEMVHERVAKALPTLILGEGKEIRVRGEFDVWNFAFDEISFPHLVLLDDLMRSFVYIEENIKPLALKKRIDLHYKPFYEYPKESAVVYEQNYISNPASVSLTISKKKAPAGTAITIYNPETEEEEKKITSKASDYLHINITQADSREVVYSFTPIFRALMSRYLKKREDVLETYRIELPLLIPSLNKKLGERVEEGKIETSKTLARKPGVKKTSCKIKELQERIPELFVLGYARRCQCTLQPTIIEKEKIDEWKAVRREDGKERQVMPFPVTDPKYYFGCPDEKNPYPGVKRNLDLSNKEVFPYIPCCFKTDHMSSTSKSKYNKLLQGQQATKTRGAKAEKKINTRKILTQGKIAYLPRAVENIVKRYSEDYIDMVRYGVPHTTNSLLHCVCVAVNNKEYFERETEDDKEAYVIGLRKAITDFISPSLLKQELYDYSDQEIMEVISDDQVFLDPALFYRAIEEVFNINIYVFMSPPPSGKESELGSLDVPRHQLFHSRPVRENRYTVLIMKMEGSESDALEYPQCELIVDDDAEGGKIKPIFPSSMATICHNVLKSSMKTITVDVKDQSILSRKNIYYSLDHLDILPFVPVSQYVDGLGKMRALTFLVPDNQKEVPVTLVVIPSQPENLPHSDKIQSVTSDFAMKLFGKPSAMDVNEQGLAVGLWFKILDIEHGEYVKIFPEKLQGFPTGPRNSLVVSGEDVVRRYSSLKRTINIIKQLVIKIYDLARSRGDTDPVDFALKYMVVDGDGDIQDSAAYYDLDLVSRKMPVMETPSQMIEVLSETAPSLFTKDGKIIMYSDDFSQKVIKMLKDHANIYPPPVPLGKKKQERILRLCADITPSSVDALRLEANSLGIPGAQSLDRQELCYSIKWRYGDYIKGFYENTADFKQVKNSIVFPSEIALDEWRELESQTEEFILRERIEKNMHKDRNPYIYRDPNGAMYIIQNASDGSKKKSLGAAKTWKSELVNLGYDAPLLTSDEPYVLFGISESFGITPIEDNTNGSSEYFMVLYYGTQAEKLTGEEERYAAILPLS